MSSSSLFSLCTVYVSNLPYNATPRDVARVFNPIGRLVDCQLFPGGHGRLVFSQPSEAERAYSSEVTVFNRPVITSLPEFRLHTQSSSFQQQQLQQIRQRRHRDRNAAAGASQVEESFLSDSFATQLRVSHEHPSYKKSVERPVDPTRVIDRALRANDLEGLRVAASTASGRKALIERCCGRWTVLPLIHELVLVKDGLNTLKCLLESLEHGAKSEPSVRQLINSKDQHGFTPLHRAVRTGLIEVAELLLSHGADPRIETERDRRTALHIHLWQGCGPLAYSLLKCGADPEACDADNWSALHWCAKNGYAEFAMHLVVYCRVRLYRSQSSTLSPLKLCLQQVNQRSASPPLEATWSSLVHLLLRHGSTLPSQSYLSDWFAASQPALVGDPEYEVIVKCLTAEGAELSPAGGQGSIQPRPLLQLCRLRLRRLLSDLCDSRSMLDRLNKLPLPQRMLDYLDLLYAWEYGLKQNGQ